MSAWIDITVPLIPGMAIWPGDEPVRVWRTESIARGAECNVGAMTATLHAGTHVDAPAHFIEGAPAIDRLPIEALIGIARVIEIANETQITRDELLPHKIQPGERILFKTPHSERCRDTPEFWPGYVHLTLEAARYLADIPILSVGIDTYSVGGVDKDDREVHVALLGRNIWIVENLDLSCVAPGTYELICLPVKIPGADAAPARALLRKTLPRFSP